jgi:hypothetical protein
MPLELQKGTVLMRNSTKEQVKSGLNMPLTISQVRSAALMTNGLNMPLAKLQERSAVLMKDPMLQVKKRKHASGTPGKVKSLPCLWGIPWDPALLLSFQKKALKDRPQAACPKKKKNSQANSQGRLNLERTSQTVGKGWRKREGESRFGLLRMKVVIIFSPKNTLDGWIPIVEQTLKDDSTLYTCT